MNFTFSSIAAGFVFGVLGVFFVRRAKKEANFWSLGVGVGLVVYPYFVENPFLLWGLGVALIVAGYLLR